MFYSMESTMAILPQICLIVLGVCLLLTELRGERPQTVSDLTSNSEDEGFGGLSAADRASGRETADCI